MAQEFDTSSTQFPKCPHCGTEDQDWWDGLGPKNDGDEWQVQCFDCGQDYTVSLYIEYSFTSEKLKEELEH